jgi:hypothetical protein
MTAPAGELHIVVEGSEEPSVAWPSLFSPPHDNGIRRARGHPCMHNGQGDMREQRAKEPIEGKKGWKLGQIERAELGVKKKKKITFLLCSARNLPRRRWGEKYVTEKVNLVQSL